MSLWRLPHETNCAIYRHLIFLMPLTAVAAGFTSWADAQGRVHYGDTATAGATPRKSPSIQAAATAGPAREKRLPSMNSSQMARQDRRRLRGKEREAGDLDKTAGKDHRDRTASARSATYTDEEKAQLLARTQARSTRMAPGANAGLFSRQRAAHVIGHRKRGAMRFGVVVLRLQLAGCARGVQPLRQRALLLAARSTRTTSPTGRSAAGNAAGASA